MHLRSIHFTLVPICITVVTADFLGPSYPTPVDLSSNHSIVSQSWDQLTSTLQSYLHDAVQDCSTAGLSGIGNITFSISMFSLNDPHATDLQFHYTSPEIANATNGTHNVDSNSIYRLASVTKVFTVLAGLLCLTPADWERPLTEIVPAFDRISQRAAVKDPIDTIQWNEVTPSALAAQIGGVTRDIMPFGIGDLLYQAALNPALDLTSFGLPTINFTDAQVYSPCVLAALEGFICNDTEYFESAATQAPTFEPWTTPGYSDNGFALLGLAIGAISGKSIEDVYQQSIFDPLGMQSSNSSTPPASEWYRSVIPDVAGFALDAGPLVSTGGLLSTTNDLAKFGIGILNSTLLPSDQTRKWLKPATDTARMQFAVGRPWEIIRYTLPSGHITDIYTKLGDSGYYSSWLVLIPDYNAGFTILSASTELTRFNLVANLTELVGSTIVPALEGQAAAEAKANFVGTYSSSIPGLNSSLTLVHDQTAIDAPGLVISSWISNSTDMLSTFPNSFGPQPWRLVPSISDPKNGKAAFFLVSASDAPSLKEVTRLFSSPGYISPDWIDNDSFTYGGLSMGSFVFDVEQGQKATSVSPVALRITLKRVG